jgi:DNA repair protein RadC
MKTSFLSLTNLLKPALIELQIKRPLNELLSNIGDSEEAVELLRDTVSLNQIDYKEHSWLICLSRANQVLGVSTLSKGSSKSTIISSQEVVQTALCVHAQALIVIHNHPSGRLKPSESDVHLTRHLAIACAFHDITLIDHIILTSESYFSFRDEGRMPEIDDKHLSKIKF